MDVDQKRKLVLISRDPRSYTWHHVQRPGRRRPERRDQHRRRLHRRRRATPADLRLLAFQQLPTGHTTTCINDCRWLWTGGPASTAKQKQPPLNWTVGRPIIVTDLRDPRHPRRRTRCSRSTCSAATASPPTRTTSTSTTPASRGSSGDGGTRGYWTDGRAPRPGQRRDRDGHAAEPGPVRGRRSRRRRVRPATQRRRLRAQPERPIGRDAPRGDDRYKRGELLLGTEEASARPRTRAARQGMFTIASLKGSYNGEAWRSTPAEAVPPEGRRHLEPADNRRARADRDLPPWRTSARRTTSTSKGALVDATPGTARARASSTSPTRRTRPGRVLPPRRHARLGVLLPQRLRLHGRPRARHRHPQAQRRRQGGLRPPRRKSSAPKMSKKQVSYLQNTHPSTGSPTPPPAGSACCAVVQ